MKEIVIFGAGWMGVKCLNKLFGWRRIRYFCDNNKEKIGKKIKGIDIISYEDMLLMAEQGDIDIILSTNISQMREQLDKDHLKYWTFYNSEKNYFNQIQVKTDMDEFLYSSWIYDKSNLEFLFKEGKDNWYREEYYSELNREIVENLEYSGICNDTKFYSDELYENRPGMRLIRNILHIQNNLKICDIACGHGELLRYLQDDGHEVFGIDANPYRVDYLQSIGIESVCSLFESIVFSEKFDVVIAQELLEHVMDLSSTIDSIVEILAPKGRVFVTVPYGKACDCSEHVRYFTENSIVSIFAQKGFLIENVLRIPYLNYEYNNGILMEVRRKE